jgi:hypothetical protein
MTVGGEETCDPALAPDDAGMTGRLLAEVALRVWALWTLIATIAAAPGALLFAWRMAVDTTADPSQRSSMRTTVTMMILGLLIQGLASILLLMWAGSVARLAVPQTPPLTIRAGASELLMVGFALVGVVLLVTGLAHGVVPALYDLASKPEGDETSLTTYVWRRHQDVILASLVQVAAGVIILCGRRGLAQAWSRLRSLRDA